MTGLTIERRAAGVAHRADAGTVKIGGRDIDGLVLCAEHGGAPYDLLAAALAVQPARLRAITARMPPHSAKPRPQRGTGPARRHPQRPPIFTRRDHPRG